MALRMHLGNYHDVPKIGSVVASIMLYLMGRGAGGGHRGTVCDTIYEAESTYILSDFLNALIYNDHCAVGRISIVAPLQLPSRHFCLTLSLSLRGNSLSLSVSTLPRIPPAALHLHIACPGCAFSKKA